MKTSKLMIISFVMGASVVLSACQTTGFNLKDGQQNLAENASITSDWGDGRRYYCANSKSPAITGTGAPTAGVTRVRAWFVDLQFRPFPHNGHVFAASDVLSADGILNIPQDAIANAPGNSYKAPCSNIGPHNYQFTVYFLNARGEAIGIKELAPSPSIP